MITDWALARFSFAILKWIIMTYKMEIISKRTLMMLAFVSICAIAFSSPIKVVNKMTGGSFPIVADGKACTYSSTAKMPMWWMYRHAFSAMTLSS